MTVKLEARIIDAWRESDPGLNCKPQSRLLAHFQIFGIDFHAEAFAVDEEGNPTDSYWNQTLDALTDAFAADEPWQTIAIGGRAYVVFLSPFSREIVT